ncbi:hypothetical protein NC653_009906 [Populus alba x Populus x berolinensis]|uniref:Uncharacterized protein n=1 Tax=Populus alba x Populus x berolinensis TaxID=444605 RepID=A0AAD6RAN1_9ROSI|nr:hypothetical protein NC653_009906 [Populus alba x Populus x berolinensis]
MTNVVHQPTLTIYDILNPLNIFDIYKWKLD